ncbi:MAG TPA: ABC transporter permease, partial [Gemmatimonadaceae bacterium]|nr:ABC transporter permease [Gemmatimonadaceae bacterium]
HILPDAAHALRRIRMSPGFSFVAVLTLALGSGVTTAMFSVVHAVVLSPLPVPDPDRVAVMYETNPNSNSWTTSDPNYLDYRDLTHSFSAYGAIGGRSASLTGRGDPILLNGAGATASYFTIFGDRPLLGAVYGAENDQIGGDRHVVLLSEPIWRRVFAADPRVVGTDIVLDGVAHRVLGVMPAGYGGFPNDFWVPLAPDPASNRGSHLLQAFGRLKPGVSLAQAQQDFTTVAHELSQRYPKSNGVWGARLAPFADYIVGPQLRTQVLVLFAAVGFVLLLACANVANLLLVRATGRQREIAVRSALGAGRGRLVQQLLTESVVLSLLGAVGGIAIAWAAMPVVRAASPFGIPRLDVVSLSVPVLAFAVGAAVVTGVLFGLAPAYYGIGRDVQQSLREGGRSVAGAGRRTRNALVVSEVALATVLLIGAGLLGRSFLRLQQVPTGFATEHILQLTVTAPNDMPKPDRPAFFDKIERALAVVPGVTSIGASSVPPYSPGAVTRTQFLAEGHEARQDEFFAADWRSVTPGFFSTLGLRLVRGRLFTVDDIDGHPPVTLIDETMAKRLWPGQDPIGKHIMAAQSARGPKDNLEVVGVVSDMRDQSLASAPEPIVYWSEAQKPWIQLTFFVRSSQGAAAIAGGVREAFRSAAPGTPIPELIPLADNIATTLAPQRFTSWLLAAFAALALLLASIGLYGVVAHTVALRTSELGIRLALGASPARVARSVLTESCVLAASGVVI